MTGTQEGKKTLSALPTGDNEKRMHCMHSLWPLSIIYSVSERFFIDTKLKNIKHKSKISPCIYPVKER